MKSNSLNFTDLTYETHHVHNIYASQYITPHSQTTITERNLNFKDELQATPFMLQDTWEQNDQGCEEQEISLKPQPASSQTLG